MSSEAHDFVRPYRSGRMKGVYVPIDQETWEHTLRMAQIPLDTPLSKIQIRRYPSKAKTIILKVSLVK